MSAGTDSPSSSRALVALTAAARTTQAHRPIHRAADFLTHLIATALLLPQARERRRAEPVEVIAAYQATIARLRQINHQ